ncbi:hypothetical protein [Streptomyces sp. NPDC001401]|uniref:hypothetical protein n=1 Tax=Streptomyces sp. NPDC001401 TaxID=3364570 RepID=UPI00369DFDE1
MSGDVAIAVISAGSALMASVITGGVAWLVMRIQLAHQAREQRSARREQLLRNVLAQCLEAISKARLELAAIGRAAVTQAEEVRAEAERELDGAVRALFTHRTHLTLIADITLQRLAADMTDAFEQLWHKQAETLAAGTPLTEDELWSVQTQEAEKLERTMAHFVARANDVLSSL